MGIESVVPTGLKKRGGGLSFQLPSDESLGYFHMPLRGKKIRTTCRDSEKEQRRKKNVSKTTRDFP